MSKFVFACTDGIGSLDTEVFYLAGLDRLSGPRLINVSGLTEETLELEHEKDVPFGSDRYFSAQAETY